MANGTAKLTSNKNGATRLTGTVNKDSLVAGTDVIFNIDTNGDGTPEQYKNVGEGAPSIETSLDLPIAWGIVGEQLSLVSPKGNSFVVNAGDKVYIKVSDEFGGIIGGKDVEYTVTYAGKDGKTYVYNTSSKKFDEVTGSATPISGKSSVEYGLIPITLQNQMKVPGDIKSATITAKYGNVTLTENNVITYKNADVTPTDFALANAKYDVKSGKGIVELTFTSPVNSTSVMKDMFEITGTAGKVVIGDVTVDSQDSTKVILTLDDVNPTLSREGAYTVTVDNTKEVAGITYELCDNNGKELVENTVDFTTNSKATGLTYALNSNQLTIKCDNNTAANATYRVVYNGSYDVTTVNTDKKIVTDESGVVDVESSNNQITLILNNTVTIDGDITVYHNGGSVTISKADLIKHFATVKINDSATMSNGLNLINSKGVKLIDKDQKPLTTGIVILTNYAENDKGVWVETDYIVTAVSVADNDGKGTFLTAEKSAVYNTLTFNNVLTFDPAILANTTSPADDVTVSYADINDNNVTKTVTYTATISGGKIVFTEKPSA